MKELEGLFAPETDRFRLNDVFFSRTDTRGVISSGNVVFHNVSAFVWPELVGKPHKIIRHPDMPKGVFHLAWETLKSGEAVGAYVLNRAQDGAIYWVFAIMMPIEEGYLSVRLKPSSDMLEKVKPIYAKLRLAEMNEGVEAEASAKALQEHIIALGFESYRDFMSQAISNELESRVNMLDMKPLKAINSLNIVTDRVALIESLGTKVSDLFSRTEQIPYNMRLQAGRLEGSDGPISVISENHRQMSQALTASVGDFQSAAALGAGPVREAVFGMGTILLIKEVIAQLEVEEGMSEGEKAVDLNALRGLEGLYTRQARSAISDVSLRVQQFARMCKDMRRMLSGLEMTRIMCKIERSKAVGDTEGLDEIVNRLLHAEKDIGAVMTDIDNAIRDIIESSERVLKSDLAAGRLADNPQLLSA